jgi:hypothetical protein
MKQHQPALSRLTRLVKKKEEKTKKTFPLLRSPPASYTKSAPPKLKLKTNSYSSIFSCIAITHTCPAKISFCVNTFCSCGLHLNV